MLLIHGDCIEEMQEIPDHSINLILTDLPYGTTSCNWDAIIPFDSLWEQYKRVLVKGGTVALFGSEPFSSELRMSNIEWFRYDWIWDKGQSATGANANISPLKKHEIISIFQQPYDELYDTTEHFNRLKRYMIKEKKKSGLTNKQIQKLLGSFMTRHYFTTKSQFTVPSKDAYAKLQSTGFWQKPYSVIKKEFDKEKKQAFQNTSIYNPQMTIGKPYKEHSGPNARAHGNGTHTTKENLGTRFPTSIIYFPRETGFHPTQKPVELCRYLIRTYTNEGQNVLDSCMGSGTTGVACILENRNFYGIERDSAYFQIATKRIDDALELQKNT